MAVYYLEVNSAEPNLHSLLDSCSTLAINYHGLQWVVRGRIFSENVQMIMIGRTEVSIFCAFCKVVEKDTSS